jgi:hypothetical protein
MLFMNQSKRQHVIEYESGGGRGDVTQSQYKVMQKHKPCVCVCAQPC